MRRSRTLSRIRNGETVRMCSLGHYIPAFLRHAADAGYDCIWLDLEHRSFTDRDVPALLAMSHLHDIDVMVRAPTLEKPRLYRFLEDGAAGLMIPHVNSADRARMLVDATKFPPIGDRGLDGAGLDADYFVRGAEGVEEYLSRVNEETFLIVQIETPEAVRNAAEIAATVGVDGLFVGPGDLGLRLRQQASSLTIEDAIATVAGVCRDHNKAWGMPVGSQMELQQRREQGAQLLAHGGDFGAIQAMLQRCVAAFDE